LIFLAVRANLIYDDTAKSTGDVFIGILGKGIVGLGKL